MFVCCEKCVLFASVLSIAFVPQVNEGKYYIKAKESATRVESIDSTLFPRAYIRIRTRTHTF